jgi:hypothetical protein
MFYWQLLVFFLLFLTTVRMTSSTDDDDSKICFVITGSPNGDAKCSAYCINKKKKAGGTCQKKRCVCFNSPSKGDKDNQNQNSQSRQLLSSNIDSTLCRLYCKNLEKFDGLYGKKICDCSK